MAPRKASPVQVLAEQRRLRILAFDPRPSWGSAFIRRALEADPSFEVATRVRASRGPEVRTGAAPIVLGDATLAPFDLALIGAPEELSASELSALDRFASVRGGTVVFVADRASSGGYLRLLGHVDARRDAAREADQGHRLGRRWACAVPSSRIRRRCRRGPMPSPRSPMARDDGRRW